MVVSRSVHPSLPECQQSSAEEAQALMQERAPLTIMARAEGRPPDATDARATDAPHDEDATATPLMTEAPHPIDPKEAPLSTQPAPSGAPSEGETMSGPITPRTRKASLLSADVQKSTPSRTLHASKSMSNLATPSRTPLRRKPRMSYITSPTHAEKEPSPQRQRNVSAPLSPAASAHVPNGAEVEALLTSCANYARGQTPKRPGSSLHTDMLQAIAAKERLCLELREQLNTEEQHLNSLRNAWQRLAVRGGVQIVPSPPPPSRAHGLARQRSTLFSPSSAQARRTTDVPPLPSQPSAPRTLPSQAPAPRASVGQTPAPAPRPTQPSGPPLPSQVMSAAKQGPTDSPSWRGLTRLPHQLSSFMDQIAPPVQDEGPARNPAHDIASWLSAREQEGQGQPSARVAADVLGQPTANTSPSKKRTSGLMDWAREAPLVPPKDEGDVGLSDKLVTGWNVLSKRLIEKTSNLADPTTWNAADGLLGPPSSRDSLGRDLWDAPGSASSEEPARRSMHSASPLSSRSSVLGLRSMMRNARHDEDTSPIPPPKPPQVPPKGPPAQRALSTSDVPQRAPAPPTRPVLESSEPDGSGDAGDSSYLIGMDDADDSDRVSIIDHAPEDVSVLVTSATQDTEPVPGSATEPAAAEPAAAEPVATEPAATEPAATEPAATEPATADPIASSPDTPASAMQPTSKSADASAPATD